MREREKERPREGERHPERGRPRQRKGREGRVLFVNIILLVVLLYYWVYVISRYNINYRIILSRSRLYIEYYCQLY